MKNDVCRVNVRWYAVEAAMEGPVSRKVQLEQLVKKAAELGTQAAKLNDGGEYANAETMLEGALALRAKCYEELEQLGVVRAGEKDWSLITAKLEAGLAYSKTALNKHEEAYQLYQKCLPVVESFQKEERDRGVLLMNYAETLNALQRSHDAIEQCQLALSILKLHHKDDELLASALANYAGYHCLVKKYQEAKAPAAQAFNIFFKKLGKRNEYTKQAWNNYYCILKELGEDEAAKDFETDWKTLAEGPNSKHSEKLNDRQIEDIRKRLEDRLFTKKRAEPAGSVKDPYFYQTELNDFMESWKKEGFDLSDPAHEAALKKELSALKRGTKQSADSLQRETERIAHVAKQHGEDWDAMLSQLDDIHQQTQALDNAIAHDRAAANQARAEELASRPKTKPGPSKELLDEIAAMKVAKAEKARIKAEAEKAAAEAAAKAAAEAAAKGKGKKKR